MRNPLTQLKVLQLIKNYCLIEHLLMSPSRERHPAGGAPGQGGVRWCLVDLAVTVNILDVIDDVNACFSFL